MIKPEAAILFIILSVTFSSCGSGDVEKVKADSTVTSASVGNVKLPDAINTDTTTAAPVPLNDTAVLTKADTQAVSFPDDAKEQENKPSKTKSH